METLEILAIAAVIHLALYIIVKRKKKTPEQRALEWVNKRIDRETIERENRWNLYD